LGPAPRERSVLIPVELRRPWKGGASTNEVDYRGAPARPPRPRNGKSLGGRGPARLFGRTGGASGRPSLQKTPNKINGLGQRLRHQWRRAVEPPIVPESAPPKTKLLGGDLMPGQCKYCGSTTSAGGSCSRSPTKHHVVYLAGKCIYCGSTTSAGGSCSNSPTKHHVVDAGPKKCIYCGSTTSAGGSCSNSPSRGHVLGGGML
jgi:hypothetical protein